MEPEPEPLFSAGSASLILRLGTTHTYSGNSRVVFEEYLIVSEGQILLRHYSDFMQESLVIVSDRAGLLSRSRFFSAGSASLVLRLGTTQTYSGNNRDVLKSTL